MTWIDQVEVSFQCKEKCPGNLFKGSVNHSFCSPTETAGDSTLTSQW